SGLSAGERAPEPPSYVDKAECGTLPQAPTPSVGRAVMSEYDQAVEALYRAPLSNFVAERKRLAAALKAAGDKDAAARIMRLVRPPVSAWVVNQLWWLEQSAFEALLAAA